MEKGIEKCEHSKDINVGFFVASVNNARKSRKIFIVHLSEA